MKWQRITRAGITYWSVEHWQRDRVSHGFGERTLCSPEAWQKSLGKDAVLTLEQVHGDSVATLGAGQLSSYSSGSISADAWALPLAATTAANTAVAVRTADCLPVLLYEPSASIIAAAHCGWRSSVAGLLPNTIESIRRLGGEPERLEVALGPGAGPCCYRVGEELVKAFSEAEKNLEPAFEPLRGKGLEQSVFEKDKAFYADIAALLRNQLRSLGITEERIFSIGHCKNLPR